MNVPHLTLLALLLGLVACACAEVYFFEDFEGEFGWTTSQAKKASGSQIFQYDGVWKVEKPQTLNDLATNGLVVKSPSKHHAISTKLPEPLIFDKDKEFVLQYEVRLQKTLNCGGAYLKLLTHSDDLSPETFDSQTPYTIMFGPDRCGTSNKVHFIFRHPNPLNGTIEEKHVTSAPSVKMDQLSNVYTLIIRPDNTFKILINLEEERSGSLFTDFNPPVNPPKEIDDPTDSKPTDWIDEAKIPDPDAHKPEDWDEEAPLMIEDESAQKPEDWLDDEPEYIADPGAQKPADWSDDDDGNWEAPLIINPKCQNTGCGVWKRPQIKNPHYKGKWNAPLIDNPAYKGPWKARQIPNPHHYEDPHPNIFSPVGAIGFELWTLQEDIFFDNILICDSEQKARDIAEQLWKAKHDLEEQVWLSQFEKKPKGAFEELKEKVLQFFKDFTIDPVATIQRDLALAIVLFSMSLLSVLILAMALTPKPKPAPKTQATSEATKHEKAD